MDARSSLGGLDDGLLEPDFDRAALEVMCAHPRFREAAEGISQGMLAMAMGLDDVDRWMLKDIGRTTLYLLVLMAEPILPALTVRDLCEFGVAVGAGSRGRVRAYMEFGLAHGRFELEPGEQPWTRRRLVVRPSFRRPVVDALTGAMARAGSVAPSLAAAADRLRAGLGISAAIVALQQLWISSTRLGVPRLPEIEFFLARDGAMTLLNDLSLRQATGRTALLTAAPLRRRETAARIRISRGHLDRILKDAAASGLLAVGDRDVSFAPALSEAFALWSAIQLQALRRIAAAVLAAG